MTEEIKEILNFLKEPFNKEKTHKAIDKKDTTVLLNYITNLQKENQSLKNNYNDNEQAIHKIMEENEKLKELCNKYEEEHNTAFKLWTMKMEEMPDYEEKIKYKSRNEKAIEYIENNLKSFLYSIEYKTLLNILQGGDE